VTEIQLSTDAARTLTDRIKIALEGTWQLITEAYTSRAWNALGYDTWDAYCATEFGAARLRPPREQRRDVITSLRDAGLSLRAIESATSVTRKTIIRDCAQVVESPPPAAVTGVDGKTYPAPTQPQETSPVAARDRRRPLPQALTTATRDLTKAADRLVRLTADDRFTRNKEAAHDRMPELLAAATGTVTALTAMDLPAATTTTEARRWWAASLRNLADALTGVANSLEKEQ
jgi:hypothetical protein